MEFNDKREVNTEELEKMHDELRSVAHTLYNKYGPEGISDLIHILTIVMEDDISNAMTSKIYF